MRWPSVSLTFLKRSRSMNSTPTRRPQRLACAIACARRSCSSRRLGRPVSASRVAMCCSRSSAWIRERNVLHERQDRDDVARRRRARHEWYHSHQIVSPSIAVVARQAGRARLLAADQLARAAPPTAPRSASWSSGLPSIRHPQHLVGAPAEDVLGLRRPAHEPEIAVPLEHRQRRVVDVRRQHPVGAAQRVLVALLVVDVGVHGVDADDVAFGVAVRRVVDGLPALARPAAARSSCSTETVSPSSTRSRQRLASARSAPRRRRRRPGGPVTSLRFEAQPLLVVPVHEPVAVVAVDVGHARRHVVHDEPQLGFRCAQRFLRLLQAVDVVHQDERAVHVARRRRVGDHADRHPAA